MSQKNKKAWWAFHKANPHVYKLFEELTFRAIARGRQRYSAQTIIEQIRWHFDIETGDESFKLNDHHKPYYARYFMHLHPEHEGFFETRQLAP